MTLPFLLVPVALFALALMLLLFMVQRRNNDAGIVDAGWAGGLGLAALWYAMAAPGEPVHRLLLALVAAPWGFRLAVYLFRDRVLRGEEDGRYQTLRAHWGDRAQLFFFLFFLLQALLIPLFSIPFLATALQTRGLQIWDLVGLLMGWGAIAGESLADRQLSRWRSQPENRGKTCRAGLWRYSRHPNYFFEWLHWWAYIFFCIGSPWILAAFAGPALIMLLLFRVSGIPYKEAQALKSRGDDYRDYQQSTSLFIPWFPKKRISP